MNKIFITYLILFSNLCLANVYETSAKQYIQKKYLKGRKQTLLIVEDRKIVFKKHKVFQIGNPGKPSQLWRIWVSQKGQVQEYKTDGHIKGLLQSIKEPLNSVILDKSDPKAAEKLSQSLLSYLGQNNSFVQCEMQKEYIRTCKLGFASDPSAEYAVLVIDLQMSKVSFKR